jgi:hypothetical protein
VITYDGSRVRLYVNGALDPTSFAATGNITASVNDLLFGTTYTTGGSKFNGMLDDIRIYNRALTATDVEQLYLSTGGLVGWWKFDEASSGTCTSQTIVDSTGNGNAGACNNSPTWVPGKIGTGAMSFNGSNQYVNVSSLNTTTYSQISLCSWVKVISIPSTYSEIVGDVATDAFIQINSSGGVQSATYFGGNVRGAVATIGTNWTNLCMTWSSGSGVSFYVNGVLHDTTSNETGSLSLTSLWMARYVDGTYLNALIDDVRIYNRALSASDVANLYSYSGKTGGFFGLNK